MNWKKNWAIASCIGMLAAGAIASCSGVTHSMDTKTGDTKTGEHSGDHAEMDPSGTDHSAMDQPEHQIKEGHSHGSMSHEPLMIPAGQPTPTLNLTVQPDTVRGWNLQAAVSHFTFAPERVNQASVTTEGHAHLYINGEKITRLYAPWYYIPALPPGEHSIRVELNANGHEPLVGADGAIEDTVTVTVPES